jgi:hypothetical protein
MAAMVAGCGAPADFTFELSVHSMRGTVTLDGARAERVERHASSPERGHDEIAIAVVVELPEGRVEEIVRPGLCDPETYPNLELESIRYDVMNVGALYPQLVCQCCDGLTIINRVR